jgi:DNA-binding MarR family transcriptional regulator
MDGTEPADDGGEIDLLAVFPRLTQLGSVLNRSGLVERAMERVGLGLDRPAMTVLVTLRMAGQPLRVGEIARRMQVVGPHVTRQVNDLERRGLARRVADPDDQRARLIEPTPDGAAAADRYLRTLLGWFTEALAGWPAQDRRDFGRLLGRFVDDLTARLNAIDHGDLPPRNERDVNHG